jgi:hypothetical protein
MTNYVNMPDKVYLVREKATGKFRAGTGKTAIPKIYKHNPGLIVGEQLVELSIKVEEKLQKIGPNGDTLVVL